MDKIPSKIPDCWSTKKYYTNNDQPENSSTCKLFK